MLSRASSICFRTCSQRFDEMMSAKRSPNPSTILFTSQSAPVSCTSSPTCSRETSRSVSCKVGTAMSFRPTGTGRYPLKHSTRSLIRTFLTRILPVPSKAGSKMAFFDWCFSMRNQKFSRLKVSFLNSRNRTVGSARGLNRCVVDPPASSKETEASESHELLSSASLGDTGVSPVTVPTATAAAENPLLRSPGSSLGSSLIWI
mmetsp:Transcript_18820/g.43587  ORF Transcript_18820/g.43587 Transcript_18820/m.43587 type:complete len:203 (-) Transcript_18820:920-1528(-)